MPQKTRWGCGGEGVGFDLHWAEEQQENLSALIVIRNVTFCVCIRWGLAHYGNTSWKCGESTETQGGTMLAVRASEKLLEIWFHLLFRLN